MLTRKIFSLQVVSRSTCSTTTTTDNNNSNNYNSNDKFLTVTKLDNNLTVA